ncbi:hypothetical protein F4820DRAFT_415927 [Hypoxylon rubiginosum]|uniref:Uncharacterized protein n=1 Tax=Hypoxylon rubiginosum TaxID=110542 RepID=A0ACB9Z5U7_9PEZI|nr:hypothetical protein F4820DRAFT_415927 [Hypoxylon rubiginosum]
MMAPVLSNIAVVLALCASLIAALPVEIEGNTVYTIKDIRSSSCSMENIRECIDDTGLESTLCFAKVCGTDQTPTTRMTKRQDDQCTEENLLQCTVMEWREAEICFQELCL